MFSVLAVPIISQRIWPQSSVESGSYDTDYEQHDISPEVGFPLSTFQSKSSMREIILKEEYQHFSKNILIKSTLE